MKGYLLFLALLLVVCYVPAGAQVDTLGLHGKTLVTSALKPGLKQYLVYSQNSKAGNKLGFSFWLRNVAVETKNGEKVFSIRQQWFGSDSANYRKVFSLNKATDFSPIYHAETIKGIIKAYNWNQAKIIGADTIKNNAQKDFVLDFSVPNFNWNLDIETFEMLPLAKGKAFAINFYDAGLGAPKYVLYRVEGDEFIRTYDNQKVDCWILITEGTRGGNKYAQRFWISKKGHEFLKEEDVFGGNYRYKIKMPLTAPNILSKFSQ